MFKSYITAGLPLAYCVSCQHVSDDSVTPPSVIWPTWLCMFSIC